MPDHTLLSSLLYLLYLLSSKSVTSVDSPTSVTPSLSLVLRAARLSLSLTGFICARVLRAL